MTSETMTFAAFRQLLDTHGSRMAAWPVDEREAAEMLLSFSSEAREALASAQAEDEILRASLPRAPVGLLDRIMIASGAFAPSDTKIKRSAG